MTTIQYGTYIKEMCCEDCDYAGGYKNMGSRLPPMPISICPDCGGKLKEQVGRWMYTRTLSKWWHDYLVGFGPKTTYHGFLRGRNTSPVPPPPDPDNNYTLEASLAAYKAGHPEAGKNDE